MAMAGLAMALSSGAFAESPQSVVAPPPPPVLESGEALEPEVTIREERRETVYEYRIAGKLVMVKVQPKGGFPPYYYYNQDDDPDLEHSQYHPQHAPNVNQWVLFRWW